ncbi:MAG: MCE family protein [Pleurocapsa sp. SU_5_0]|nr:MCE family protein [Pleurocapsa sp. SU_5_0]NJR47139.1 MCE family protein [Hyellaceae cyanobacterium CSU_1_1]
MRSRTLREGSVGLLIILGILLFGGLALWIRGFTFGKTSYQIIADFSDVNGIKIGDGVRYRGLQVGRVDNIQPSTNGVDVVIEIDSSNLLIPRDVTLMATSSGLIGNTFIDIIPESSLTANVANMNPTGSNCNSQQIICDNARLKGEKAITLDDLLPYTYRFSKAYGEPEFVAKVNSTVENAGIAASEVANLTKNTTALVNDLQKEVRKTSQELVSTAETFQTTAKQVNRLTNNVEQLIAQNESNLTTTLASISTTSDRLETLVVKIDQTVDAADTKKLANNLNELTTNAAAASNNLKNITESFGSDQGVVSLQQTLDSARVTFDNAQKITSDLESLTGDPAFLKNVRDLVNGLGGLVSSTEQLEQQIQTSQRIKPLQSNKFTSFTTESFTKK